MTSVDSALSSNRPGGSLGNLIDDALTAWKAGDEDRAYAVARRVETSGTNERPSLAEAARLFLTFGRQDDVLRCLEQMSRISELTALESYTASSILSSAGRFEEAVNYGMDAVRKDPANPEYLHTCGTLLNYAGRSRDAAVVLVRAAKLDGTNASVFRQLSASCVAQKKPDEALAFARRALDLDPLNFEYGVNYATQAGNAKDIEEAVRVLAELEEQPHAPIYIYIYLVSYLCQLQRYENAMAGVERGLKHFPDSVDLLMSEGFLHCCMVNYNRAADSFLNVLKIRPGHEDALRGCFLALTEAGRYTEATGVGAQLMVLAPNDKQVGSSLVHIMHRRFVSEDFIDPTVAGNGLSIKATKRRVRRDGHALADNVITLQARIWGALILREMKTRFGRSKMGFAWALFEPLAHIGIMVALISTFGKGTPPIGDSFAVFYFTGIIPYHVFTHTGTQIMQSVSANRPLLQLPIVTTLDAFIARALLEFGSELTVSFIFISAFLLFGLNAVPLQPLGVLAAFILIWVAAFGVGIINAVVAAFFPPWEKLWGAVMSVLYFSSGTFYVPKMMPEEIRDILVWNPVLQAIEMLRVNYFHEPSPPWLDVKYLAIWALTALATGLILERVFRRKLLEAE